MQILPLCFDIIFQFCAIDMISASRDSFRLFRFFCNFCHFNIKAKIFKNLLICLFFIVCNLNLLYVRLSQIEPKIIALYGALWFAL